MSKGLFASPTFMFRDRHNSREAQEAARDMLRRLLSTEKGTVLSAPGYGLPPLAEYDDDSANEQMVQAIIAAIRTYLPQLEKHFGTLYVESEVQDNETIFVVYFKFDEDEEEIELSTRYVDARWVVLNRG